MKTEAQSCYIISSHSKYIAQPEFQPRCVGLQWHTRHVTWAPLDAEILMNHVACHELYLICLIQLSLSLGTYRYRDPSVGIGTGLSLRLFLPSLTWCHSGHLAVSDLAFLEEESTPLGDTQKMSWGLHWPTWGWVTTFEAITGL